VIAITETGGEFKKPVMARQLRSGGSKWFQASPLGKKVCETPCKWKKEKQGMVVCACHLSCHRKHKIGRLQSRLA
jgi:hypothetical protein